MWTNDHLRRYEDPRQLATFLLCLMIETEERLGFRPCDKVVVLSYLAALDSGLQDDIRRFTPKLPDYLDEMTQLAWEYSELKKSNPKRKDAL
jgi:hypothetical protein